MTSSRSIFREAIPVDDRWHSVQVRGRILHVATRGEDYVEIWFNHDPSITHWEREFRVYGTGQSGVKGAHVGTAITPSGRLVWHLMERAS
jgi:hypothetical protein